MSKTLLSLVQTACGELGLKVPTVVGSDTSQQAVQFTALANAAGVSLMEDYEWPFLRRTATINLVNGVATYQLTEVASGGSYSCNRMVCETGWDLTNIWAFAGSISDQVWNLYKYGSLALPVTKMFRMVADDTVDILPVPTVSGGQIVVNFITDLWASAPAAGFPPKVGLVSDTDVHLFSERLMELSLIWRWRRAKGFDYDEERDQYERMLPKRKAASRPARTLSLARGPGTPHFLDVQNIPRTGYGG